ncbi:MAG: hypothetical protein ACREOZ_03530, partial [Gloeomargaritales cyanobacterium]
QPVCGKRCLNAASKPQKTSSDARKPRISWDSDGPSKDVSSLSVIIDWLSNQTNYSRWKGDKGQAGERKSALAAEMLKLITEKGIKHKRTAKDICQKVSVIEGQFRSTYDWMTSKGLGTCPDETIEAQVRKKCNFFL